MSPLDWGVLVATLAAFVLYGVWRSRGTRDMDGFVTSGRSLPWPMVALSVMATQASAITFLAGPGQGFAAGLSFVQFYLGLPLAMVVLCIAFIPVFQRWRVYTAYEYLERRFDGKTRSLAAALFLLQRGLAAGLTLYAPALILSVLLGWNLSLVCALLGGLVVLSITLGGARAVSHTQALQFTIIIATMIVAFVVVLRALPGGTSAVDALALAGHMGRMNALDLEFDPDSRYNLWSGLIGGFFLQLAYFGTDQSQVGRYLGGASVAESRLGLLFNGVFKLPMQFFILMLGVLVFVFYQFTPQPAFFNPALVAKARTGAHAEAWNFAEYHFALAQRDQANATATWLAVRHSGDAAAEEQADRALRDAAERTQARRAAVLDVIRRSAPGADANDTNYVFLSFVLAHLPIGLVGLVLAAVFAASMNSSSAELNALASTTVVDVVRRVPGAPTGERALVAWSRGATVFWTVFAVLFAEYASRLGTLIEAVNILGSLFYGVLLGLFLTAFLAKRVTGTPVFVAAIVAELLLLALFKFSKIAFLWYNPIGAVATLVLAVTLSFVLPGGRRPANA